VKTNITLGT